MLKLKPIEKRLTFNEENHLYLLDGKKITGCTTILKCIAKPALIQWAANMAVDYLKERIDDLYGVYKVDDKAFSKILEQARQAHARKRDKAGDLGTTTHLILSQWIIAEMRRTQTP